MTNKTELVICTSDSALLEALFQSAHPNKGQLCHADEAGLEIEFLDRSTTPGINQSEILINIALSIVAGLPTSLMAAWIYEKLSNNGKNALVVKETREIVVTQKDIEVKIVETIERIER